MSALFQPAISLMNQLTYPKKMVSVSVLFMVPLVLVSWLFMGELATGISATEKERRGLEYIKTVRQVYQHFPQHRGMTNAYLNGAEAFREKIMAKREAIKADIQTIDEVNARFGDEFETHELWSGIKSDWKQLEQRAFDGPAADVFAAHTTLISRVYHLFELISEHSGLLLDPRLNTFYLMDSTIYRIPVVTENLGQSRGLGSGVAAKGAVTLDQRVKLVVMVANIESNRATVEKGLRIAFEENEGLESELGGLNNASAQASASFASLIKNDILQPDSISIEAKTVFSAGTEAIKANYKLYDALVPILDRLFVQRSGELSGERNLLMAIIVLGVVLAFYLFAGFYFSVIRAINSLDQSVNQIAEGDLTVSVDIGTEDELKSVEEALNSMVSHLKGIVAQLGTHSSQLAAASTELSVTTEQARNGALDQQAQTEQIATAMNEMSATVHEIASNAEMASADAQKADEDAKEGGEVVQETIDSINNLSEEVGQAAEVIHELEKNSIEIGSVLDVIRGIAEQTNLLALNAAIEAARAGEQGRGFAVVADEVRTLAGRTQESTEQIQKMIESLQSHTKKAVDVMETDKDHAEKMASQAGNASTSIEKIISAVGHILDMTTQVAAASEEQSVVTEEINRNVTSVADVTHASVTGTEQIATASEELSRLATELQEVVAHFKV